MGATNLSMLAHGAWDVHACTNNGTMLPCALDHAANVDYEAWVRQRIREAARSTTATKATAAPVAHALQTAAAAVLPPAPATREAPAAAAAPLHVDQPTQLVPSIRPNR